MYCLPEKMGIKSEAIFEYVKKLEDSRLFTHDMIIMRHGKIIYEAYWKPFHEEFQHRMYSVSKSFVSIAIGFLIQEGKISLDDKLEKYFYDELKNQDDENMHNQTIRHTLMMSTCKPCRYWFSAKPKDRVKYYFENTSKNTRPSGTVFEYDSCGSFVLGALVERICGMPFMDYLRIKLFDKIGVSKEAYCLKCPGGHSWGDSAILCTPRDLMLVAQFIMNKGEWNGEQILDREYVESAISNQINTNILGSNEADEQGYGYLIWRTFDNSFYFNGMGCQLAICIPDKDIVFVYNGDNQGKAQAKKIIIENFFEMISRKCEDNPVVEDFSSIRALAEYTSKLSLKTAIGNKTSLMLDEINDVTYVLNENTMGIAKIKFKLDDSKGVFYYTNEQGDKELPFGMCENIYDYFPQDGYSDEIANTAGNRRYKCASSAAWIAPNVLEIQVQIIDKYFGVLDMRFGFTENKVAVYMYKVAEDFLSEYCGSATGYMRREDRRCS